MKPVLGLVSDTLPLGGYRKGPYLLIYSTIGVASCVAIGVVPASVMSPLVSCMCVSGLQLQVSACDLLTEAKYAERMQAKPARGPDLVVYVWAGMTAAGLVASAASGPAIQFLGPKSTYL